MTVNSDPVDLIDGLTSADDVSKTETVAELKAVLRRFGDADEVRNTHLSDRFAIYIADLGIFQKDTESTEDDDGSAFIVDGDGVVWVNQGSGSLIVDGTPISGGTDTGLLYNKAGVLGNAEGLLWVEGGPLSIVPTSGSNNQGLLVTQVGPTSVGPFAGPLALNLITASYGGGVSGSGTDSFGLYNNNIAAFRINFAVGGANLGGSSGPNNPVSAGIFAIRSTSANTAGDKIGLNGTAYTNVNDNTGGGYFGLVGYVQADSSAVNPLIVGGELDVKVTSGATIARRVALSIANVGNGQASTLDTAIYLSSNTVGGEFKNFVKFSNFYGQTPLATTATMFSWDHAATIANVFDFTSSAVTVTGNILGFPNVTLTGAGVATFSGGALTVNIASGGSSVVSATTDTTSGFSGIDFNTPSSLNELFIAANTPSNTGTRFGLTRGNYTEMVSAGSSSLGMLIGTTTSDPIILGTNNVQRAQITSGGLVTIGPAFTPNSGELLTINANTAALPAGTFAGTLLHLGGANSTAARIYLDTFAANSSFAFRRANGTLASRTAIAASDNLGGFFWDGFDGTGYNTTDAPALFGQAAENFSTTAHGTDIVITTVPKTTLVSKQCVLFSADRNVVLNDAALATNATDGFLYIPTCAGAPSGTPTAYTGRIPMIYDTTNDKFWFYRSGWKQPKTPAGAAIVTWQ